MPSKINPVPIRMPEALRGRVKAFAKAQGCSEHSALIRLITAGLDDADARGGATPLKVAPLVPLAGTFERKPLQKSPPKRSWKV